MKARKPKIGLVGIMQELYDDMLPGITKRQANYAEDIVKELSDVAEVVFNVPARVREDIEKQVKEFNNSNVDGIMIVMLTYSPGMRIVRALQENNLPILLANIQPVPEVTKDWDMGDLTYNQGIHGAQDNANAILRGGINFEVITGNWKSETFKSHFLSWAKAAQTITKLKNMKVAVFGQMPGMGDITVDSTSFLRKIGPQINHESLGSIYSIFEKVSNSEIQELLERQKKIFYIDPSLKKENYEYAARFEIAIRKFLESKGYEAFSIYFQAVADDGRFKQLPMMAASDLLAEGYGYGAEGDVCAASLVAAGHSLIGDAHFAEMYAMDFKRDSVLISHMGEGNWKVARKDRPIKLIDRPLGIGGLDNPPTIVFSAQPGPATIASLAPIEGEKIRLIVSHGNVLDTEEMPHVEMPYFHFKPSNGIENTLNGWLKNGGTHHQCLNLGDQRERWRILCKMLDIEYIEV